MPGINELSKEEFVAVKAHPMFEAIVKTSGLVVIEEKPEKPHKTKAELKAEKKAKELADQEAEELLYSDEDTSDEERDQDSEK